MDYELLLNEIINIGKEMIKSGAETNRVEDSMYRMLESYDIGQCSVFAIQSNIQVTIRSKDGTFITQVRRVHRTGFNYDRLDYLNNLSRYICRNQPSVAEIQEKYDEVMSRKKQPAYIEYLASLMGGVGFGVYFGCDLEDTLVGIVVTVLVLVWFGRRLKRKEHNLVAYNLIVSFVATAGIFGAYHLGFGNHPDRTCLGLSMVLISGLCVANGLRDLVSRAYLSGFLNIIHAFVGAVGIACGAGLAMILFRGEMYEMCLTPSVPAQLISCGIASMGFAWLFKAADKQAFYVGIGGSMTWGAYLIAQYLHGDTFICTIVAAAVVAAYAFIMSRYHRAPATIFLTTSILPVVPGANLFYMMYGIEQRDYAMANQQAIMLATTCLAIAFGFLLVDIASQYVHKQKE